MRTPATAGADTRVPLPGSLAFATLARTRRGAVPGRGRKDDKARVCKRGNSYSPGARRAAAVAEFRAAGSRARTAPRRGLLSPHVYIGPPKRVEVYNRGSRIGESMEKLRAAEPASGAAGKE